MLDNGSRDGSAEAARAHPDGRRDDRARPSAAARRSTTRELLRRARGRYALLLERGLRAAARARRSRCWQALRGAPRAALRGGAAAAPRRRAAGRRAWRFPTPLTALAGALFLHRLLTVQSRGEAVRGGRLVPVGGAARAARGGRSRWATWTPTSSSTPTRSTSPGACATPAGAACTCRARGAIHHEQLSTDRRARARGSWNSRATATCTCASTTRAAAARAVRWLTAWTYALRALAALVLPGHAPRRYWRHVARDAAARARRGPARGRRASTTGARPRKADARR